MYVPFFREKLKAENAHFRAITFVFAVALAMRFLFSQTADVPILYSDSETYLNGARLLFEHLALDIYRPPIYPLLLLISSLLFGWDFAATGAVMLQILLSLLSLYLAYLIGLRLYGNGLFPFLCSLIPAMSMSFYGWDFMVMTESLSIFLTTLSCWLLIEYFHTKKISLLIAENVVIFMMIFTKPFFLLYPGIVFIILLFRIVYMGDIPARKTLANFFAWLCLIAVSVLVYSAVNYVQSGIFGFSVVGNVNTFGKVLQYHMEQYGEDSQITSDIMDFYGKASEEQLVEGDFPEPWNFIGKYGYNKEQYRRIGKYAYSAIKNQPLVYLGKSIGLTWKLMCKSDPFRNYIARFAMNPDTMEGKLLSLINTMQDKAMDLLHYLIPLSVFELVFSIILKRKWTKRTFIFSVLAAVVLYHYVTAAFLSYGDYARLLAPCYHLIIILILDYCFRFVRFIRSAWNRLVEIIPKSE